MASNYYINGIGIISPQRTFSNQEFLPEISTYHENVLTCITPDFKDYINPIQLRRLSRMLRIGLSAATICVRDTNNVNTDGIITATGYGFLRETAKFINEMYALHEKQLTPTYFMQSTYNALAGLVALSLKCKGYNNTYVNKGFAFETALQDTMMQLDENNSHNILVGAYDETDEVQYTITSRVGHYKKERINNLELYEHKTVGSLQGEGAAFFSISGQPSKTCWCILKDVKMIFMPALVEALETELQDFLFKNTINLQDVDLVISGASGDVVNDEMINTLTLSTLSHIQQVRFKHLCGEYCTSSSFGMWLAASIIKNQKIPLALISNKAKQKKSVTTILLINHYNGRNYSFMLFNRQ